MILPFEEMIQGEHPVLLEFTNGAPDRADVNAELRSVQDQLGGKLVAMKADFNHNPGLAEHYKVNVLPQFILFVNGKEIWRKEGVFTAAEVMKALGA